MYLVIESKSEMPMKQRGLTGGTDGREKACLCMGCVLGMVDVLKVLYMPACKGSYGAPVQQNEAENKF